MSSLKTDLAESGTFDQVSLPRILLALHVSGFDGSLRIYCGQRHRQFRFEHGSPVLSESLLSGDDLRADPASEAILTADDLDRVRKYASENRISETAALAALEILDPLELLHLLRGQTCRRLLDCMAWRTGKYELAPSKEKSLEARPLSCSLPPIVQQGLAAHWGVDHLFDELGEGIKGYASPRPGFDGLVEEFSLSSKQAGLLHTLQGHRSVAEVLGEESNSSDLLAALWVLERLEFVVFSQAPTHDWQEGDTRFDAEIEIRLGGPAEAPSPSPRQTARSLPTNEALGEGLRSEIEERSRCVDGTGLYELLGISPSANSAAIKKAYFQAAKRYHPDSLARLGLQDIKAQASEIFSHIARAFEVLSNPSSREDYDAQQRGELSDTSARLLAQSETAYRKGEILLRMGDFSRAHPYLASAVEIWPDDGAYRSALGWVLYKGSPSDPTAAREHLQIAVELGPQDAVAHFRLGVVLRSLGENKDARAWLERAKELEPRAE